MSTDEFANAVKARVYVPVIWQLEFEFPGVTKGSIDPWHVELTRALRAVQADGGGGGGAVGAAADLQRPGLGAR